jgi:hypothetical protein
MRHALYEDPVTRKFTLIRVPPTFAEGDELPMPPTVQWLDTRADVISALPVLFEVEEDDTVS